MKSQSVTKTFADNQEGEQVWQENSLFQFSQNCLSWYPPPPPDVKCLVYTVKIVLPRRQIWIRQNEKKKKIHITLQGLALETDSILRCISFYKVFISIYEVSNSFLNCISTPGACPEAFWTHRLCAE